MQRFVNHTSTRWILIVYPYPWLNVAEKWYAPLILYDLCCFMSYKWRIVVSLSHLMFFVLFYALHVQNSGMLLTLSSLLSGFYTRFLFHIYLFRSYWCRKVTCSRFPLFFSHNFVCFLHSFLLRLHAISVYWLRNSIKFVYFLSHSHIKISVSRLRSISVYFLAHFSSKSSVFLIVLSPSLSYKLFCFSWLFMLF